MSVIAAIKELLETKNYLIVPKFGGFVMNYKATTIQEGTVVSIAPARNQLSFNSSLNLDDGILIKYISQKECISDQQAKQEVDLFVNNTLQILKDAQFVSFEGLGNFRINKSRKIEFYPNYTGLELPDSFGLPVLQFSLSEGHQVSHNSFLHIGSRRTLVKRALLVSPVVIAVALLPTGIYRNIQESSVLPLGDSLVQASIVSPTNALDDTQKQVLKVLENTTSRDAAFMYKEDTSQEKYYHIIVGCFRDSQNANKFIQELASQNIKGEILEKKGYFRISAASFLNKEDAKKYVISKKSAQAVFADAWVYDAK